MTSLLFFPADPPFNNGAAPLGRNQCGAGSPPRRHIAHPLLTQRALPGLNICSPEQEDRVAEEEPKCVCNSYPACVPPPQMSWKGLADQHNAGGGPSTPGANNTECSPAATRAEHGPSTSTASPTPPGISGRETRRVARPFLARFPAAKWRLWEQVISRDIPRMAGPSGAMRHPCPSPLHTQPYPPLD